MFRFKGLEFGGLGRTFSDRLKASKKHSKICKMWAWRDVYGFLEYFRL